MSRVLFCDWKNAPETAKSATLFELTDLSDYDIVFFDPLRFAISAGLRQNENEVYKTEYLPCSEDELRTFVAGIKMAVEVLRDFVIGGGMFVVRSNLPKSFIKVTKKSIVGVISNKYTESVVSIFYWLEEFLGKFACQYGIEHSFSYIAPRSRIYKAFGQCPAESICAVTLNSTEFQYVIAESSHEPYHPLIYAVSGKHGLGDTYIIPKFLIDDEAARLADLFTEIHKHKTSGIDYPFWVDRFEQKLNRANPFNRQVFDIDKEIEYLRRKRAQVFEQSEDIRELLQLVYGQGEDLKYAVKKAFDIIGFQFPAKPDSLKDIPFDLYMRNENASSIAVDVYASDKYAVDIEEYERTMKKVDACEREDKPKIIIVANAANTVVPNKRVQEFTDEMIRKNNARGYTLLSAVNLFELACSVLDSLQSPNLDEMKASIQKDILESKGEYKADMRKYFAVTTV
ncbi:MAG: hypothetical protein R3F48_06215 [Candidatus Zixiibacteriota bacterium]